MLCILTHVAAMYSDASQRQLQHILGTANHQLQCTPSEVLLQTPGALVWSKIWQKNIKQERCCLLLNLYHLVHFWEINLGSAVVRHRVSAWWTAGSGGQMSVSGVKMSSPLEDSLVIHPWVINWHLGKQTLCWVPSKYRVNKCDVQFPHLIA